MMKEVMILAGAGQIGMAIARRMGYGMKIVVGDKKIENAQTIAETMKAAGFDVLPMEMDLSSRESILHFIKICLQSVRQDVPEQRMRWQMLQNC